MLGAGLVLGSEFNLDTSQYHEILKCWFLHHPSNLWFQMCLCRFMTYAVLLRHQTQPKLIQIIIHQRFQSETKALKLYGNYNTIIVITIII